MYAESDLLPWFRALVANRPGLQITDGHLHVGLADPAGFEVTAAQVLESLATADAHGVVFPLSEPAGYRDANDRVLDLARQHPDRITAFARLDPADGAAAEARRCVGQGAAGLKLHPRGEDFELDDRRLDEVFAFAHEQRLPVVVHAGVGTPQVGPHARQRAEQHPDARIILAHGAIGSFEETVPAMHELPNLFVDTSWWNISDLWALFRLVPASQIVHASDVPFNSPVQGAITSGRLALQAGLSDDQVAGVLGGNLRRLLGREDLERGERVATEVDALTPELERLYVTLCSAVVPMLAGDPPGEGLELAKAACGGPSDRHADVLDSVAQLLDLAEACTDPDPLRPLRRPGWDLVLTAALVARTPAVALPDPP
ncbi:MAG: hypothetical protein JWM47_1144 [Acidimicrobiales bacterium]|nr:hypothetical protein [Acidimicrobiales bacterium]